MSLPLMAWIYEIYSVFYVSVVIQRRNPLLQIPNVLLKTRFMNAGNGRCWTALTSNIIKTDKVKPAPGWAIRFRNSREIWNIKMAYFRARL